jgi:hypothetical protein
MVYPILRQAANAAGQTADGRGVTSFATEVVFWVLLPALVAMGAAYLVWLLMQARIQVLTAHYQTAVAKVENDSRITGMDELLAELRVERRRFLRRLPGPKGLETTVITQERLYLRNLPLTGWMQDELTLGTGEELAGETVAVPLLNPVSSSVLPVAGT